MLNFLEDCNISKKTIKIIEQNNYETNIYNLSCNENDIIKTINYFKEIGINCIESLLINKIELFMLKYDEIVQKIEQENIQEFVISINNNIDNIDKIMQ